MNTRKKRLVRHTGNTKIAGVCGAVAEYIGVNARWVRLATLVLTILTVVFPGVLLYLTLMVFIPREDANTQAPDTTDKPELK